MNNFQKQLKRYYHDIEKTLVCKHSLKKTIVAELKSNVDCYIENHEMANIDDIVGHFGTASAIAQSQLECMPQDKLIRRIAIRDKIILIVIIIATIILLIYGGAVAVETYQFCDEMNGYSEISIYEDKNQSYCN